MYISHKKAQLSNFDFIIVGSGVLGITLASELEKLNKKILLIEGNGNKDFRRIQNFTRAVF